MTISENTRLIPLTQGKFAISLGLFETQEQAAIAYNEAAKKHFKEFAKLNDL